MPLKAAEFQIVTEDFPPMNYEDDGGFKGISTDIVKAVMKRAGLPFNAALYPWARAYNMALKQKNVMIYSIAKTPERENHFRWIGPMYPFSESLFRLKKRGDIKVNSLEDAKAWRIGVVREYAVHQFLKGKGFKDDEELDPTSSQTLNLKKLFRGRVDLIVGAAGDLAYRMNKNPDLPPFEEIEEVFGLKEVFTEVYMAFGLKTPDETVNRVRTAFEQLKSGENLIKSS